MPMPIEPVLRGTPNGRGVGASLLLLAAPGRAVVGHLRFERGAGWTFARLGSSDDAIDPAPAIAEATRLYPDG